MRMPRRSPLKSPKLPMDCSPEEFERACEFVKKVKEIDQDRNYRGIFLEYTTAMKLYQSGSLNLSDLKNRVGRIFQNCDVLLAGFRQILKDSWNWGPRRGDVVIDFSNLKRIKEFVKMLSRNCKELRGEFIETFVRFKEHGDVQILKEDVDLILRDYPCLKKEFRTILLDHGLRDDEITREEEDDLFESDMYLHGLESAIDFAAAEDNEKPSVGVYGAIRRFYEQRRNPFPRKSMKDPKIAIRSILPALQRKHKELLIKKENRLRRCCNRFAV